MQGGVLAGMAKKTAITVDTDWGSNSAGTSPITSATRTMSAPPGSTLLLDITATDGSITAQYSKNGGAFTTFTDLGTLSIAHGDTLAFRVTGAGSIGNGYSLNVKNNADSAAVGTCSFTRT